MKRILQSLVSISLLTLMIMVQGCGLSAANLNRKAQIYMKHGRYDIAKEKLKESVSKNYQYGPSHYWLAQCYMKLGEYSDAKWEYELAIKFDPSMELAQMEYVRLLYNSGEVAKSLEVAEKFLSTRMGDVRYFTRLAENFKADNMNQHTVLAYQAAIRKAGGNVEPIITLADFYYEHGEKDKGDEMLKLAFNKNRYYPGLARKMGAKGLRTIFERPAPKPKRKPHSGSTTDLMDF